MTGWAQAQISFFCDLIPAWPFNSCSHAMKNAAAADCLYRSGQQGTTKHTEAES